MNQISEKSHCHILIALWTISAILLVIPYPIASSSEAREAHVIADIVLNGNWLFPTRAGIIPSKPPLYHISNSIPTCDFICFVYSDTVYNELTKNKWL